MGVARDLALDSRTIFVFYERDLGRPLRKRCPNCEAVTDWSGYLALIAVLVSWILSFFSTNFQFQNNENIQTNVWK